MPSKLNSPSSRLLDAILRSPWKTRTVTAVWLSTAVLKTFFFSTGTVVLRSTSAVRSARHSLANEVPAELGGEIDAFLSETAAWLPR